MSDELYILRKYVMAPNALAAIRLDRKTPVSEVVLVEEKSAEDIPAPVDAVGFRTVEPFEDED